MFTVKKEQQEKSLLRWGNKKVYSKILVELLGFFLCFENYQISHKKLFMYKTTLVCSMIGQYYYNEGDYLATRLKRKKRKSWNPTNQLP